MTFARCNAFLEHFVRLCCVSLLQLQFDKFFVGCFVGLLGAIAVAMLSASRVEGCCVVVFLLLTCNGWIAAMCTAVAVLPQGGRCCSVAAIVAAVVWIYCCC